MNFTVATELLARTWQEFTVELIPFKAYPLIEYFRTTRNVVNDDMNTYNSISAYVALGEIHTYYKSNWKACGNTFINADGSSNMDEAIVNQYCGYNTNTITWNKDDTTFFPDLAQYLGIQWEKEFEIWTYSKDW